jgi:Ca2+-transporting ATPase
MADLQPGAKGSLLSSVDQRTLALILAGGALCNDAMVVSGVQGGNNQPALIGDPTEGALVVAAARLGLSKTTLEQALPRVAELPFDSTRKRMTTVHRVEHAVMAEQPGAYASLLEEQTWLVGEAPYIAFTKGAVDGLLEVTSALWRDGHSEVLTGQTREQIVQTNDQLARSGMRVLGVAFRPIDAPVDTTVPTELERDLIFIGMLAMIDPARAEVKEAVAICQSAGIRPVMITGDHPLTALAIARELGMSQDQQVLTGSDLDRLSDQELKLLVERVPVYARVSPEHKLRIVQALQANGQIVAMTGDGVNDAPALKKADIGVAMGITGTDVTKEAADMVLQDDNFATIVAAVAEGRVIFDNIRKFIRFLMGTNAGELWVMLIAPLLGMPLPLLPLQILWVNLVTDGLPALALSAEPAEQHAMRRPPHPPNEHIFARGLGRSILLSGIVMALIVLGVGYSYWWLGLAQWQTMIFFTITLTQMANVLAIRSERESLFRIGLLSNKPLLGAVLLTVALQLLLIYTPPLQGLFNTMALSLTDLLIGIAASSLLFWFVELEKWWGRRRDAAHPGTGSALSG